jgi:hypothetical protein
MAGNLLDQIYRKLAFSPGPPEEGFPVLDELAEDYRSRTRADHSHEDWCGEANYCLHKIGESSPLFVAAVSRWLTADEYIGLAFALVEKASVRHLQQEFPEAYDLSGIDESRAILVAFRLCARYTAPAVTLGWALSLATSLPATDQTERAVAYLLQHHMEEYPQSTRMLLSHNDSPYASIKQARKALGLLDQQEEVLRNLPNLRELSMTPEMRLTLSSVKRRQDRDLNRRSREKSILSAVCASNFSFKYSKQTALETMFEGQVHETTMNMKPFSVTIELPLSELTDPMAGMLKRRSLQGWPSQ